MQAGQCGNQMGTTFWEVVCDEHGIGGDCEYCGGSNTQLGRINVFSQGTSGGKYLPHTVLFDILPGVIDAVRASPLGALFRPGNLVNENAGAGKNLSKRASTPGLRRGSSRCWP
jgi:tubulin beta